MSGKEKFWMGLTTLLALMALVFGFMGWSYGSQAEVEARGVRERISIEASEDVILKNGADLLVYSDAKSTSKFTVDGATGATSVGDKLTAVGEVVAGSVVATITTGSTYNPTASFVIVDTSGAITVTLGTTGAVAGQLLILYGQDANNVTVNDTNLLSSTGSALTIGQYDVLGLIFDGTKWTELFLLANS